MEELKALIAAKYEIIEIIDILGIEEEELLDAFEERVLENLYEFRDIHPEEIEAIDD
jgi:hypothetical protein